MLLSPGGISLGAIMGIVFGCVVVVLLVALMVVLLIPKYREHFLAYGNPDAGESPNDVPMDSPQHIDPLDIMRDVMGDDTETGGGATAMSNPQYYAGPEKLDPTTTVDPEGGRY